MIWDHWEYLYAYTPRYVVIKNRRLGVFWRSLQLIIVVYLIWNLTRDLSWAMQVQTPEGFHDQWIDTSSTSYYSEIGLDEERAHCLHPEKLSYKWSDDYVYHPSGCIALNEGDIWQRGESMTFIPTYFDDTWVEQASGAKECARLEKCCADGTCFGNKRVGVFKNETHISTVKGIATCRCEAEASYFVKGVAGLPMLLSSSYSVATAGQKRQSGSTSRVQDELIVFVENPMEAGVKEEPETSDKAAKDEASEVPASTRTTVARTAATSTSAAPPATTQPADHDSVVIESGGNLHIYGSTRSQQQTDDGGNAPNLGRGPPKPGEAGMTGKGPSVKEQGPAGKGPPEKKKAPAGKVLPEKEKGLAGMGPSERENGPNLWERSLHEHNPMSSPAEISMMRAEAGRMSQRKMESLRESVAKPYERSSQRQEGKSKITKIPFSATRFEPGSAVGMSLEKWLEHAEVTDGDFAGQPFYKAKNGSRSLLDTDNTEVTPRSGPGSEEKHPPFRMTGLELTLDVSFENKASHGISGIDGVVMKVKVLARGGWHSRPTTHVQIPLDPESGRTKYLQRYYYGISCKIKSSGKFAEWSVFAIAAALTSIVAFWQVPGAIITMIALYLLGSASLVYYGAAMDTVHVDETLTGMSLRALSSYYSFQNRIKRVVSADGKEGLSRDKLEKDLKAALGGENCLLGEEQLNKSTNLIFDLFDPDDDKVIQASQMTDIAMQGEFVKFDEAADKFSGRPDSKFVEVFQKIFIGKDDSLEDVSALIPAAVQALRHKKRAKRHNNAVPTNPVCYLTSTGFVTDSQWARFIKIVLKKRGVLQPEDEEVEDRAALVAKYKKEIQELKVTFMNDASYYRPPDDLLKERAGKLKVGHKHLGRGEGTVFWWDQALEDLMGVLPANIRMVQLLEKPWLFNHPQRLDNTHASRPNRKELDKEDEKKYRAALKLTQDAYNALRRDPPEVGAGQAGQLLSGCPASGLSCGNELLNISKDLNQKYAAAVDDWCTEHFDNADIVVGQGGELVMLNMAWQCNPQIASRLVEAVRTNQTVYAGLGASSVVCAKSIEMAGIQPGWIESFAANGATDSEVFSLLSLLSRSNEVLGALPILEAPVAMRPNYTEDWGEEVLAKNLAAEKDFEEEHHIEVPDHLARHSINGCQVGCRLLTMISKVSETHGRPVSVPLRAGEVIEVNIIIEDNTFKHEDFALFA